MVVQPYSHPKLARYLEDYWAIAGEGRLVLNPRIWAIGTVFGGGGLANQGNIA